MKRLLLPLLCLPLLFAACTKNTTDDDNPDPKQPVVVTFDCNAGVLPDFSAPTRSNGSVDEDIAEDTSIDNINIYVWPSGDPASMIHRYQTSGQGISLPLSVGTYHVRVVANVGYDMGSKTPEALEQLESSDLLSAEQQRRTLLFAAKKEITLTGVERLFNIELQRLFARTYVNVRVADNMQGNIELVSAQVCNIPTTAALFGAPAGTDNYPDAGRCTYNSTVKEAVGNSIADLVYTYENLKPSNPAITTQAQRGGGNAPAGATYVHIIANTPLGFYNYVIYLGENNTSNFTIRRNTSTRYDITLQGTNMVDLRVTTVFFCSMSSGKNQFDLLTWPSSASTAVFDYGRFGSYFTLPHMEGRCFMKVFADQYNFDNGANWSDSDKTSLVPLTSRYGYAIYLRGFGKNIPHPNYATEALYGFYYGNPDALALQTFNSDRARKYGYYVNFKIEGIPYSAFEVIDCKQTPTVENVMDVVSSDFTTAGTASIFAYPSAEKADTPHFDFSFRWPSQYRFLGFYNKDGVQFNPTGAPIGDGDVSWSTNGKGTTTAFWREANKGSGDITLKFEKRTVTVLDVTTTPLTDGIAHKASPFTITIGNSGNFTGTIAFTNGSGTIKQGTAICTNSVALTSGDNKLTITPTSIGNVAFNITVKDSTGLSKTLYYSMSVIPMDLSIKIYLEPDESSKQHVQITDVYSVTHIVGYLSPLIINAYCSLSEPAPFAMTVDVNSTWIYEFLEGFSGGRPNIPIYSNKKNEHSSILLPINSGAKLSEKRQICQYTTQAYWYVRQNDPSNPRDESYIYNQGARLSTFSVIASPTEDETITINLTMDYAKAENILYNLGRF